MLSQTEAVHFHLLLLVKNNYDTILGVVLSGLVTYFLVRKLIWKSSDGIPGRLGLPLVGETFSFVLGSFSSKGCYDFVRLRRQWYGAWFKTRLFGQVHVFVPSVDAAKTILSDHDQFPISVIKSFADVLGKNSVTRLGDEDHKRVRRLLTGPFSTDSFSAFVPNLDMLISTEFKKLAEEGKSFALLDFSKKILCGAICDMLMSIKEESILRKIDRECYAVSNAVTSLPLMIPGTEYYKGMKARERVMKFFEEIITSRRSSKDAHQDILQWMLEKFDDDLQIMDNLLTFILGGQAPSAIAIMWSVKFLDDNKEAQNMLREEQLSILRMKPSGDLLSLEDLKKMSYGSKVVKETLRMANVLPWHPRTAVDDCKIQDFDIKKGWILNVDSTHIHQDPAVYKDPLLFNPSRFDETPKPYAYTPFGHGPHMCLGMNMATVIMLVFLHRLTSGYHWTVDDHDPSFETQSMFPVLRSKLPITLTAIKDKS